MSKNKNINTNKDKNINTSINTKNNSNILICLILSFCAAILIYAFSLGINGNDFWWHVKAGEWIINHKSIPTKDIFSWYASSNNFYWFSHEWLSEVILYFFYSLGGTIGIFVMSLFLAIIILLFFFNASKEYFNKNLILSSIYSLLFTCLVYVYCYGRPQIFTYILLNIEILILYKYKENKNRNIIWFLPLISLVWANIHGGSSNLSYILPIILMVSMCLNFSFGKIEFKREKKENIIKLLCATIISMVTICLNPHGPKLLLYPFTNMGDKLMLKLITEWAAPDAKDIAQLIFFFIPVISVTILFIATDKKIDGYDFLNYGFFAYLFFRSTRFIIFFMIVSAYFAFKYLIDSKKKPSYEGKKEEKLLFGLLFGICAFLGLFGIINIRTTYNSKQGLIKTVVSKEFIDLVKKDKPKRLFNDYNFGETLIFEDIPVFIDSRADVYTGEVLKDYVSLRFLSNNNEKYDNETFVDDIINKYDFDAFLIEKRSSLLPYLSSHPEKYEIIKSSDKEVYIKVKE